ncbi:DNA-binding NarL/FixJ family response regulator [Clostridium saccharoperbutylacetonicum]|uniref:Response regulator n=1 Tax=Clostridium saccharoperbutylacetonicum N1-4(HMT) TaxID=931276 RepID=M1MFG4_9CLOT|nr:helix-turn-helix transcriptional regulator [Clostridium saccharoperbutylacetonicum]AGF56654.1 response regulator [Clostridium saccharoperbutylacetonicum N1-4(HMT)]NRT62592.1 DNA-binding NarL/FixJ family response regulator [Clostridium saccharoperbutylacetonicum]NSB25940.1 DNA-binding NarL/FixJ family response regulator [Clostridium saccharoperbutylacetonicum]NSB45298.1 DNA-binding NarL/FixJ family response regulator [Clostridium saccharoperbutylacetonicum]
MRNLETNDWMVINNIVYQINSIEDSVTMRKNFLTQMALILNFDSADFYIAEELNSHTLINPVFYNYIPKADENYMDKYDGIDYSRGLMFGGKSKVYRESDIISEEKRVQSEYYKKYFEPNNWHHTLNMILANKGQFVGVVCFFRLKGKEDYTYEDSFILDMIKEHLAFRLFQDLNKSTAGSEKISVSECAKTYSLTKREESVLHELINGAESNEISNKLCITPNTLKKHVLNIYRKLNIKNRIQLFKMVKEKE